MALINKEAAELMEQQLLTPVLWFSKLSMHLDKELVRQYHEYSLPIRDSYDDWLATVYLLFLEDYNYPQIEDVRITRGATHYLKLITKPTENFYIPIPDEFLTK